jgi:hypothetical protein
MTMAQVTGGKIRIIFVIIERAKELGAWLRCYTE